MRLKVEESKSLLTVTIYWMGGQNLDRSFTLVDSTSEYTFQLSRNPDTETVSCISPPPGVDISVFPEHPFYLPQWLDGFYHLLDKESNQIKPFLDIPILVASTSANKLEPASDHDTQNNINTSTEINLKAPKKRRANVLEVNMNDKKTHPDMPEKTEM